MKRFLSMAAAVLLSMCAMAQSQGIALTMGYGQPTFREGLGTGNYYVGERLDTWAAGDYGIGKTVRYKGFQVGIMYEATIIKGFGLAAHVDYTFGYNASSWQAQEYSYSGFPRYRAKMEMHCLDFAVDWQYKFEVASNTYIIVYSGPTIDVNVDGKTKMFDDEQRYTNKEFHQDPMSTNPTDVTELIEGGYGDFAYSRWNVMWGIGAGFQYKKYFIRGGYDFGLVNGYKNKQAQIDAENVANIRCRQDQWQIKLGIFFWQRD